MDMNKSKKHFVIILFLCLIASILSSITTVLIYNSISTRNNYFDGNINKVVEIASFDNEESKSFGTGWFIDGCTIVTNYHVVSYLYQNERIEFDNIEIRFYDEESYYNSSIIKYDKIKDIAYLKYDGNHYHSYFKTSLDYRNTDKCFSIGNFLNYGLSYKEGYISLSSINLEYNRTYSNYIQCSITIGQGDSGAPLFNKDNEVIGMITFRVKNLTGDVEQGFGYAIPINNILML